jgi:hypothetical protein
VGRDNPKDVVSAAITEFLDTVRQGLEDMKAKKASRRRVVALQ